MLTPMNVVALDHFTRLAGRKLSVPVECVSLLDGDCLLLTGSYGLSKHITLLLSWSIMRQVVPSGRPLPATRVRTDRL